MPTPTFLQVSYRADYPPVLRGIDLHLQAGQRVGVVGRTGAGKSTLVGALLRLVDRDSGSLTIDGIDVCDVGLHQLRPRISVIPQTPFLFSGTVRQNLDPFNRHTDVEIWAALETSGVKEVVQALPDAVDSAGMILGSGLLAMCEENGGNFSVGERQLLCLARAILSRNRILIMDEATANVDLDTDRKVQQAIRECFSERGCTVIMIAHRLRTIIDCDQVLVMHDGTIAEAGHPHELLAKYLGSNDLNSSQNLAAAAAAATTSADTKERPDPPRSSLASMTLETGPTMSLQLRRLAATAYSRTRINITAGITDLHSASHTNSGSAEMVKA
jgi:ABC-type multidrug transport system fused ATPase/permease subunit